MMVGNLESDDVVRFDSMILNERASSHLEYDIGVAFDSSLISGLDVSCQGLFYWTKQSSPIRSNRQRRGHTPLQNPVVTPLQTLTGLLGDVGIIWW